MKFRKLSLFLFVATLCALTTSAFAEPEEGFYEKHDIRGFISIGGDYRGMRSAYVDYLNKTLFKRNFGHIIETQAPGDTAVTKTFERDESVGKYEHFDDYYIGLHVEVGAQSGVLFEPVFVVRLNPYDVKWFSYGIDWMFGWKLFGENTVINLIPSVGIGFNLLNVHLGSNYSFKTDDGDTVKVRNRYYSVFSPTFNAQLELRFALDPFSVGAYGGYRVIRFDEFDVEGYKLGDPDNNGDTWFIGAKLTWTFLSENQRKLRDKL